MSPKPQMILKSRHLLLRLMGDRHTCNSLGRAIGRSRQLMAHLAYGRRTSTSTETATLIARELGVEVTDLFMPGANDESSSTRRECR